MKLVIANKKGQAKQVEVEDKLLMSKKIGETIKGDALGFEGYEFEVKGGSDKSGFPMRRDVQGSGRKGILIVSGLGLRKKNAGDRRRRTVSGNTVGVNTAQVNLYVTKEGKEALFEEPQAEEPAQEEAKTEEKKE